MATLGDLAASFDNRLECMHTLVDLQFAAEEVDSNKHFENLMNEVEKLENVLAMMRSIVNKQTEESKQIQEVKTLFQGLINNLEYSCSNVPSHIPKPTKKETSLPEQKVKKVDDSASQSNTIAPVKSKSTEVKASKKTTKSKLFIPTLEYITVEEFDAVPKYMKGRISYTQLNAAVDELNKPFNEKYKILGMKRITLNDINRKRYEKYKLQETKDTAGEYFIVDEDIKDFSSLKMDSVGRAILTVLRHCCRLKEIRGSGHTRYAYLPVY